MSLKAPPDTRPATVAMAQTASFSAIAPRRLSRPRVCGAFLVLAAVLALGACAPVRVRQTPQMLAAQRAREASLRPVTSWALNAHIAVSNGHDGGSGQLEWRQQGDHYSFTVRAPVTGRTWKLTGDAGQAVLEGVDPQPDHGTDAGELLRDRLGWNVPLSDLRAWIRGLRAPHQPAQLQFNAQSLPAVIGQNGWTVEYRDWYTGRNPPLPRKVFASKGAAHVRVVIENWSLHE